MINIINIKKNNKNIFNKKEITIKYIKINLKK